METKFSTSFIPKQTLARTGGTTRPQHVNLLALIAVGVFIVSTAVGVGMYLYKNKLTADLAQIDSEIRDRKAAFELGQIEEVKQFQQRIDGARALVSNHVAFSGFFTLLEDTTVPDVAFQSLVFHMSDLEATVELEGVAKSFSAVAQQSDAFLERPELSHHVFGNFHLSKNGYVEFVYTASVARSGISYIALLEQQ